MQKIEILDLVMEPDNYSVYKIVNGEKIPIALPKLSFTLFQYLVENAQKTRTLEEISEAVWQNTVVSNETITQRITLLRKAIGDDPKNPKYIESIRGRGYRLIVAPVQKASSRPRKDLTSSISAMTIVCLLAITYWYMQVSTDQIKSNAPSTADQTDEADESISALIARGNYYFNIGQNENIDRAIELFTNALSIDPENEQALVGLSLALSKSVCRYNQNASRAEKGYQLAVQASQLNSGNENASKAQAAIAYSWDCLGNLELALKHYLQAIQLDSKHYKSIGSAAHLLTVKGELLQAYQLSVRAKELEPNNPMADLQIARILELLNFSAEAKNAYQSLFVLYPDNVFINEAYPRFLYFQGHFKEARQEIEKVLSRNAGRYDIYLYHAELIWLIDNQAAALAQIENVAELNPSQSYAKNILLSINNELNAEDAKLLITRIEKLVAQGDTWPSNYIEAALISLWALKDQAASIDLLQKAIALGYLDSEYLSISPLFMPLREILEFQQVIDNINKQRESMRQLFLAAYPRPEINTVAYLEVSPKIAGKI